MGKWVSPGGAGVVLESLTSATTPPFEFAYNPLDMDHLFTRQRRIVEPSLTALWRNQTSNCCARGGHVIDVGANYGWYTLYSLALGCHVIAFEPVGAYRDAIRVGVQLNDRNGFAQRLSLYANAVYPGRHPGNFTMVVPRAGVERQRAPRHPQQPLRDGAGRVTLRSHMRTMLGMAAMLGPKGGDAIKDVIKLGPAGTSTYHEHVRAIELDDLLGASGGDVSGGALGTPTGEDAGVCMLKVDVEGLEPDVMRSGRRLLARGVGAIQLEITRKDAQRCANIAMLRDLLLCGFQLSKVSEGAEAIEIDTCYLHLPLSHELRFHLLSWRPPLLSQRLKAPLGLPLDVWPPTTRR